MDQALRRQIVAVARIAASLALAAYLVWRADPRAIWQVWRGISPALLALALALQLAGVALSAAKWGVLLSARGHALPFGWLLRQYLVGQFANNFLPTTVGGDALRVARLGKRIGDYSAAGASVFLERLTGFLALSVIALLALLLSGLPGSGVSTPLWMQLLTGGFALASLAALAVCFALPRLLARFGGWLPERVRAPLGRIAGDLANYAPRGTQLLTVLAMSFGFQLLWVLLHIVCGAALGIMLPALVYALMVPLTDMLGLVPIFFNGLGVREAVFTLYAAQAGVGASSAVALALLAFSVRLLVSLLGGAAWARGAG